MSISNPTIDFANKKLLVDATTAGTMAGGSAQTFTQEALLDLPDLSYEVRDGYLLVYSHKPVITDLSHSIVGFYRGETREPFVATIKLEGAAADQPAPVLWEIFPDLYKNPDGDPIIDNEDTFDVDVPDPALRKCILDELDLPQDAPIVNKVLKQLGSFTCIGVRLGEDEKIKSLEGLQHATNLSRLRISYHNITDLSPLQNSTRMWELDVSHNDLTSLDGIENLTNLSIISAENNKLRDLSALSGMTELSTANLDDNRISDLSQLPADNLSKLSLNRNRVSDLTPLSKRLYLRELLLEENRLTDISTLAKLPKLETVSVRKNFITDPSPLASLNRNSNLVSVKAAYNKFSDWSSLDVLDYKLRDRPEEGESPEDYLNPKNLEDVLAEDARIDAQDAKSFSDVPQDHQFHREITWLSASSITTGWPDGTFRPAASVDRASMAAFIYRMQGSPAEVIPEASPFKDVPTSHPFYKEIVWLHQQGITTGWQDGTFRPAEPVNRAAVAAFFYRLSGSPAVDVPAEGAFRDVPSTHQFAREITWFSQQNITTGWSDGTFRPADSTQRAAMAAFIYRYKTQ